MVFLQTRGYGQTYPMSEATLQDVWRTYKQTAPFQFVRVYCSEVDWLFDPADDHLLFELAALATSKELTKYFAKSLWIQNKLRLIVDPRSLAPTDYFCFPETLVPEPCRIPRTRTSAYKILNDYSRNRFGTLFRVV
jgi:hypothetical protein